VVDASRLLTLIDQRSVLLEKEGVKGCGRPFDGKNHAKLL